MRDRRGVESNIYVDAVEIDTEAETLPVRNYPGAARPDDVLVYQFATASFMAPWLASRQETLVVNYHNITPPELMAPWDNHLALGQLQAQHELRLLAPRAVTRRGGFRVQRDAPAGGGLRRRPP